MIRTFDGLGAEYDESRIVPPRIVDAVLADALRGLDPRASTLLECGTGTGQLIARASRRLAPGHVFGIDTARSALRQAARSAPAAHLIRADVVRLPFRPGAFDVILAAHLFEHVHDWQRAVRGWLVHLTDTGRLVFLVTPGFMATGPRSAMRRELRARGADLRRVGAASVASVAQWCAEQGHTVTHRASPAWSWTRTVPVAQSIRFLERRVYSAFWHVPDRLYDDALAGVRREFQDRMNHSESHDARCEYWEVRPPSTGHREGIPKNAEVLAVDRAQRRDRVGGRT